LSWEEESNVSTGDDNSPAGKCEFFYIPSGSWPRNLFQAFRLWGRRYKIVWKFGSYKTKEKEEDKTQETTKMRRGTIEGGLRLKKSTMKFV
ncbi:unnamed protein product, partial [Porites lobata]